MYYWWAAKQIALWNRLKEFSRQGVELPNKFIFAALRDVSIPGLNHLAGKSLHAKLTEKLGGEGKQKGGRGVGGILQFNEMGIEDSQH